MTPQVRELLCRLSIDGYVLGHPCICAGGVTFIASRRMPDGAIAALHLDFSIAFDRASFTAETCEGASAFVEVERFQRLMFEVWNP